MRREPTDAENRLWAILRDRRLSGFKFRRQFPVGGYILDFYCAARKLCVELDGGQHNSAAGRAYDIRRTQCLERLGIRVLRFWDPDVLKDPAVVKEMIYKAVIEGPPRVQ